MVYVIATLTVKPEMRAELIAAAREAISATRKEEGCVAYDLHESVDDSNKLVFVEEWDSADCLPVHSKSDHMRAFGRIAVKCFSAPVKVEIITPEKVEKR
ncbi:antibiotic biosynthesis monooxygenase [Afipia massiliensis]|uniref:Antibiotic biosynthesis monooxygenase n=1 Tax=Afipia massiliensis TaxID=211460 RepID=A0A4U6BKF5_9BRAD|nr:putative quinol monooxygenase [Afipia massiliensis]TKT70271.1 antibiotic biosynthesis monooxygenase [Afipia massiliensis]